MNVVNAWNGIQDTHKSAKVQMSKRHRSNMGQLQLVNVNCRGTSNIPLVRTKIKLETNINQIKTLLSSLFL